MYTRRWSSIVVVWTLTVTQALPQTPTPTAKMDVDAHPSFAVAVIKPHNPESQGSGMGFRGDRIAIRNQSLVSLIMFTYAVHTRQLADGPEWADKLRYDIDGRTDTPGESNLLQKQEMLQKLLADRFQLRFHRETRELPVYAVRIAKGGSKLKPADPDEKLNQEGWGDATEKTVVFTNAAMNNLVLGMQFLLDRPLVDQTDLPGRYDFSIHYTSDEAHATNPNAPPGIFTAVQQQLGLKFEPTKATVDVLVIDHVELPSPN